MLFTSVVVIVAGLTFSPFGFFIIIATPTLAELCTSSKRFFTRDINFGIRLSVFFFFFFFSLFFGGGEKHKHERFFSSQITKLEIVVSWHNLHIPNIMSSTAENTADLDRVVHLYLKKKQYKNTLKSLENESKVQSLDQMVTISSRAVTAETAVANQIAAHTHGDDHSASMIETQYSSLTKWIETSLDQYRNELHTVMYPIFVHCYLDFIVRQQVEEAKSFMSKHCVEHEQYHAREMEELKGVTSAEHMTQSYFVDAFRKVKYNLVWCSYSFELLVAYLQEHKFMTVLGIINQHVSIRILSGKPKEKFEAFALTGSTSEEFENLNKTKIMWGQLKQKEVEAALDKEDGDEENTEASSSKDDSEAAKRNTKAKRTHLSTVSTGPNDGQSVPLPELRGQALQIKLEQLKEMRERVTLGPNSLPSACMYTFFNTDDRMHSLTFADNVEMVAGGFADSYIKIWDLTGKGLPCLKSAEELDSMHIDGDTKLEDLQDPERPQSRDLIGHCGAIYETSFSPDNNYLVSASEDGTARLWDLKTFTNVVCYKGHIYPVWSVSFSPLGYYFATASHDRTARLWSTDQIYPLRIFAGHLSDVHCVRFHPNSNYIATGSSDRSCRLWDVNRGECVRVFEGHADAVKCLAFSDDGRYLVSGADDCNVVLWDIATGKKITTYKGHTDVIHSVSFSGEGSLIASGSADDTVRIWGTTAEIERMENPIEASFSDSNNSSSVSSSVELAAYPTKSTPIFATKFTNKNLLMCAGALSSRAVPL
eukprot:m.166247 g.166247  ORF g.166247 m.166247 type:complete len:765 (+) comp31420_c8_seq1:510-2804(+)